MIKLGFWIKTEVKSYRVALKVFLFDFTFKKMRKKIPFSTFLSVTTPVRRTHLGFKLAWES